MNTRCPKCSVELGRSPHFKLNPKCPNCKSRLLLNLHPIEMIDWVEPKMYVVGVVTFVFGWIVSQSENGAMVICLVSMFLYFIYTVLSIKSKTPPDWPRWKIDRS